jgi:DNA-binding NarL/FixJ family response regulator
MTRRAIQDFATRCASIAQSQKPEPNGRHGLSHAAPVRVLVAEDFVPYRRCICSTLASLCGLQVVGEVSDGLEAIQKAVELRPDLIVLDIGLPSLNGIETARQICKLVPEAKIIFLTQESSSDVVQLAISLGARGYVVKNKAGTDLVAAVEAVLSGMRFVSSPQALDNLSQPPKARSHY